MPLNDLYCHQQICIPPTFPYLLRQYAKAAIRSQPTDLLKWSTAYFRCLALNVPPPVKPRLEYPIPRSYLGITPGWLKALNYQLNNCKAVNYRILWDRWFGSCLDHNNLLQILCLGGFQNPDKIPWNKFIGICVGFLNDNLTQTMIMFCEIMTEEPEGGSAMITVEMFLEVYKFLAMIDASQPQILPNLYFTDVYLGLEMKKEKKKKKRHESESSITPESSVKSVEVIAAEEESAESIKGEGSLISCPDIVGDDMLKERDPDKDELDELMLTLGQKESSGGVTDEVIDYEEKSGAEDDKKDDEKEKDHEEEHKEQEEGQIGEGEHQEEGEAPLVAEQEEGEPHDHDFDHDDDDHDHDQDHHKEKLVHKEDLDDERPLSPDSKKEGTEEGTVITLESGVGEMDYDMSELERALKLEYGDKVEKEEVLPEEEEEVKIEEISIPAVPGIGPKVPDELVDAVERYIKRVAACEHGMTMPRHIRHYCCPPLEVFELDEPDDDKGA
nr:uncharacterized protein LOC111414802 [Onthophagus taurus]